MGRVKAVSENLEMKALYIKLESNNLVPLRHHAFLAEKGFKEMDVMGMESQIIKEK